MLTDNVGPVEIEVPRDRNATLEPVIVPNRVRRLGEVDTIVLSLFAKGLTTGEVSAHFAEIYGGERRPAATGECATPRARRGPGR